MRPPGPKSRSTRGRKGGAGGEQAPRELHHGILVGGEGGAGGAGSTLDGALAGSRYGTVVDDGGGEGRGRGISSGGGGGHWPASVSLVPASQSAAAAGGWSTSADISTGIWAGTTARAASAEGAAAAEGGGAGAASEPWGAARAEAASGRAGARVGAASDPLVVSFRRDDGNDDIDSSVGTSSSLTNGRQPSAPQPISGGVCRSPDRRSPTKHSVSPGTNGTLHFASVAVWYNPVPLTLRARHGNPEP
jgi:hypothetical protein